MTDLEALVIEWRDAREAFFLQLNTDTPMGERIEGWKRMEAATDALMARARRIQDTRAEDAASIGGTWTPTEGFAIPASFMMIDGAAADPDTPIEGTGQ